MLGTNFPVSDYYKNNILDAETLSRSGSWWTAVLLIADPKTDNPFIAVYRWQMTDRGWKVRKAFSCRRKAEASALAEVVERWMERLP